MATALNERVSETSASKEQAKRVFLWSLPRSCTTVFTRCMEALGKPNVEIFWEPFVSSEFYGPERRHFFANDSPHLLQEKYTFAYVRGYQEIIDVMQYVEETLGQKPVIIDADELLSEPDRILPMYCRAAGLEYDPKMLSWGKTNVKELNWHFAESMPDFDKIGLFDSAMKSSEFNPSGSRTEKSFDESSWTTDLSECIGAALPLYQKLFQMRLK